MTPAATASPSTPGFTAPDRAALGLRKLDHVVVLGANGTMGFGSAALFTQAVPKVTFLARTKEKAAEGLQAAIGQVRSNTVALRAEVGSYDDEGPAAIASAIDSGAWMPDTAPMRSMKSWRSRSAIGTGSASDRPLGGSMRRRASASSAQAGPKRTSSSRSRLNCIWRMGVLKARASTRG